MTIRQLRKKTIIIASLILIMAFVIDLTNSVLGEQNNTSNWFQRSGCFLVCLAIFMTSNKWKSLLNAKKNDEKEYLNKTKDFIFHGMGDTYRPEDEEVWEEHHNKLLASSHELLNDQFSFIEFNLLFIGTFIWGFGDIVINLISAFFSQPNIYG